MNPTPQMLERPEQAELLLEQLNREILSELLKTPSSASEIALKIERPLKTVLYRLEKLMAVDLVRVQEERKRDGRAVKVYAPCSEAGWTFPFSLTPAATVQDLLEDQILPLMGEMMGHMAAQIREELWLNFVCVDGQIHYSLNAQGQGRKERAPRKIIGTLMDLSLTPEQAQALNARLREVLDELGAQSQDSSTPTHYMGVFFVPKSDVPRD